MAIVTEYRSDHFEGLRSLWEEAFPNDPPWNQAEVAVPAKVAVQPDLLLVARDDGQVVGTAMAGYDGHRGWLYTVAVKSSHQREGVGSMLVEEAERRLAALGCGKINLQVRATNAAVTAFYRRLGYEVEERVSMGKRIAASAAG
jgi:ribosomal protein S18 acetylase RimI-like enzyme